MAKQKKNDLKGMGRIIDMLNTSPWAILPSKLSAIHELVQERLNGQNTPFEKPSDEDEEESYLTVTDDGIGIISIFGTVGRRMNMIERASGGVSTELLMRDIAQAGNDPNVKGILLHIDSPGGMVDGTQELADLVAECGKKKPVAAFSDGLMASAAYWIGSAATEVYASQTAQVGSIGVVAMHTDFSKADEQAGVKRTYVYNGKYKCMVNDAAPLTEEGKGYLQEMVDQVYGIFVADVSKFRNLSEETIFKQASKVFLAAGALDSGLIDGVQSIDETMKRLKEEAKIMNETTWKTDYPQHVQALTAEVIQKITLAEIESSHPEIIKELAARGATEERARILEIREASFDGQEALVDKLISEGVTATEAVKQLNKDMKTRLQAEVKDILLSDPGDLGANPAAEVSSRSASDELYALATKRMEEKKISYIAALTEIQKEHPELAAKVFESMKENRSKK